MISTHDVNEKGKKIKHAFAEHNDKTISTRNQGNKLFWKKKKEKEDKKNDK